MKGQKAVVGVFTYLDDALKAVDYAKGTGLDYKVYSPTYVPSLTEAVDKKRSFVPILSLLGGLFGLTAGFTLAIWTSLDWPIRVSAKNIVSIPGFVVIGYEWTILWGAMFTLSALLFFCRIPNPFRKVGYDPRFSDDKFGVVIGCDPERVDEVSGGISNTGADEVLVKGGL